MSTHRTDRHTDVSRPAAEQGKWRGTSGSAQGQRYHLAASASAKTLRLSFVKSSFKMPSSETGTNVRFPIGRI